MRIAVLSDIHGNLEALEAVFEDMVRLDVSEVFCLGDLIGYGPDPDQVVQFIKDRGIHSVIGNHELAAIDPTHLKWFNPPARESLKKTLRMLSEDSMEFISGLKQCLMAHNCRFVHGFPLDSVSTYAFAVTNNRICKILMDMPEKVCFIGHTHLLEIIEHDGQKVTRLPFPSGISHLSPERQYIVNIGSVGQPRDNNHDAKYVIFDTLELTLEVRFVTYPIQVVVEKILAAGLPEVHAKRLL